MNKFMMMVVLLAGYLWTDAANAQWWINEETDAMTGETDRYAIAEVKDRGFHVQIYLRCNSGEIRQYEWEDQYYYLKGTHVQMQIAVFEGWLATDVDQRTWKVYTPTRMVPNANSGVATVPFIQNDLYDNLFETNDRERGAIELLEMLMPLSLKIEIKEQQGGKYIVQGDGELLHYIGMCKAEVDGMLGDIEKRNNEIRAAKEKAVSEYKSNVDSYSFTVIQYFQNNFTRPEKGLIEGSYCRVKLFQIRDIISSAADDDDYRIWFGTTMGDAACYPSQYETEFKRLLEGIPQPNFSFEGEWLHLTIPIGERL